MALEESRALFQRLVEGMTTSVRRQVTTERCGEWLKNTALLDLGLLALWGALRLSHWLTVPVQKAMDAPRGATSAGDEPRRSPAGLSPGIESPESFGQLPSAVTLKTRASIDEGTAKARQRQFLYSVEDVVPVIADAEAKWKTFESAVQEHSTNADGKEIAATDRGEPQFLAIMEPKRTSAARLGQLFQLLESIASPVRKAHDDVENFAVPADDQGRLLAEIKAEAERALVEYSVAIENLASLARAAGKRYRASPGPSPSAPATKMLREAVDDHRQGLQESELEDRKRRLAEQREANAEHIT
jgi:hypothetical protein